MFVMGVVPMKPPDRDAYLFMMQDTDFLDLESLLSFKKVNKEPVNIAIIVCLVEFSDGILKKIYFTEAVSWSEVRQ